jgi:multiple sugar transport system permease protein
MGPVPPLAAPRPSRWRRLRRREDVAGYVFLSPWLLGLLVITAIPMVYSLYLSFTDYDVVRSPRWIGLDNYTRMFTSDPQYWHAVQVTVIFAIVAVPLKVAAGLGVALLLHRERRGAGTFRALFYLPSILGGSVAIALVWQAMFSANGAVNRLLGVFGIEGKPWVNDPDTALGTLIILAVWQLGAPMVIFLAGLKQIPTDYFESAAIDGASRWHTFRKVTLPTLSPVIFFNLVLETIAGFQGFTAAYVVSNGSGGPTDSTLVYSLYLYLKGFGDLEMGYASAMAWVFLVAVGGLTGLLFLAGRFWVHYADDWGL